MQEIMLYIGLYIFGILHKYIPSVNALINIIEDKMKIIKDALPSMLITFPTTCCPTSAEQVATAAKQRAANPN